MNSLHLRDRFFRQALVLLGFICAIFSDAKASSQPDWLKDVVASPVPENKKHADIMLLTIKQAIIFASALNLCSRHGQADYARRRIARIQFVSLPASLQYNADTDRVIKARAWVVAADGKHTTSRGTDDFIDTTAIFSQHIWTDQRIIRLLPTEELEVGGIIAWEYEVQAESGIFASTWYFQNNMPVVKSLFEVIPCPDGTLISHANSPRVPEAAAGTVPGSLKWEMSDIHATTGEQPPHFIRASLLLRVGAAHQPR